MLTTPQLQAILERVTYKPGYTFRVYDGRHEGQHCVITTEVADAYNPELTTTLDVHSMLPPMDSQSEFLDWLLWRTQRIETHECLEFFRVDGKPWVDPHRPNGDHDL